MCMAWLVPDHCIQKANSVAKGARERPYTNIRVSQQHDAIWRTQN